MRSKHTWSLGIDKKETPVNFFFESHYLNFMQRYNLIPDTVVGFAPYGIHMRDSFINVKLEDLAHECVHILDREGSPPPRRITHPVRSVYQIHTQGYRKSKFETRAFSNQSAVLHDSWERVDLPENMLTIFRTAPGSAERTHYWAIELARLLEAQQQQNINWRGIWK